MTPLLRELHNWNLPQRRGVVKKGKGEKVKKGKEEKLKEGKEEELQEAKEGVALGQPKYPPKEEVLEVFNLKTNL